MPSLRNVNFDTIFLGAQENVLKKAHKLALNETNNPAELYMAILAKYNCGKRLNLTQRGSFVLSSHLAGLRYNAGMKDI